MKWLDLPPIWLALALGLTWASPWALPLGAFAQSGWLCLLLGVVLTLSAVFSFWKARTTIIPREAPNGLITDGIFRITRNPIYLADVLFLLGAALILENLVGLILVPLFAGFLQRRFILGEEQTLRKAFPEAFDRYASQTRRWI